MINHHLARLGLRNRALTLSVCTTPTGGFSRASTATYTDSMGALATVAINYPRIAHYVNGVLQAPLLEAAGVNLQPYSEQANQWGSQGGCIVTANTTTAPDGTLTGDTLTRQAGATPSAGTASAFTGNGTKACSLFVKAGTSPKSFVGVWDDTAGSYNAAVNITWTAGVPAVTASFSTSPTIATPEVMTGGWYRIAFTVPSVIAANTQIVVVSPTDEEGFTGTDGDSMIVWGLQLEDAAAATSYIPNATAGTASRAADVGSADALLVATTMGYQRFAGSFITEGFSVGMEVTPSGFTQTTVGLITAVAALTLTISGGRTAETPAGTCILTVGLPALRAWENVTFATTAGRWYVEEDYLPGPVVQETLGPKGWTEGLPQYVLKLYGLAGHGSAALDAVADDLLALFEPRTNIVLSSGDVVVVRTSPAPYRGQLVQAPQGGWAVVPVTIPCRIRSATVN